MVEKQATEMTVYKLGRVLFSLKSCDQGFEQELEALLPKCLDPQSDLVVEINAGCNRDLRGLFNHILRRHYKFIWMNGCCLLSPSGHRLLVAGDSGSGKSTLAIALALGHGFKVLSEDIVLIDTERLQVIQLGMPFSFKSGTLELLRQTIGRVPEGPCYGEWYPLLDMASPADCDARFTEAIVLDGSADDSGELAVRTVTQGEYLRKALSLSNILRRKGSIDAMANSLEAARCLFLSGGTLSERLKVILEECS